MKKTIRQLSRLLLVLIMGSLVLGQFLRITISPTVAFYAQDVLVVVLLVVNASCLKQGLKEWRQWVKQVGRPKNWAQKLLVVTIGVSIISLIMTPILSLTPLLYVARTLAYVACAWLVWREQFLSKRENNQLWTWFFINFLLLSWGQYLLVPNARDLGYLGWDDHVGRMIGTWFDPAFTGLALVWAMIFFTARFQKQRRRGWLLLVSLSLVALLLTFSRANYVALLAVIGAIAMSQWQRVKKIFTPVRLVMLVLGVVIGSGGLLYYAAANPTNSLWRTNSIVLRVAAVTNQVSSLTVKEWLIGRGVFVPAPPIADSTNLPQKVTPTITSDGVPYRTTANFSDNFFLLMLGFWGLPLTIVLVGLIIKQLRRWWANQSILFYYSLALLVSAQFNQAVFQPFILLLLLLLMVFYHNNSDCGRVPINRL